MELNLFIISTQGFKHPCSWTGMADFTLCKLCKEGHVVWSVWSSIISIALALEDLGMRPGLKVFRLLPCTFHLFPSCLSLLVSTSSLICIFSQECRSGSRLRSGGTWQSWGAGFTESQIALTILLPYFSCPLFPRLLSSIPLSHPFKIP